MTPLHVICVFLGAALAAVGAVTGHATDVMPIAALIVGGILGNAQGLPPAAAWGRRSTDVARPPEKV